MQTVVMEAVGAIIREADEVEVFEMFGGGLPVIACQPKAETQNDWATIHTNVQQASTDEIIELLFPYVYGAACGAGTGRGLHNFFVQKLKLNL